jgi:hypothetical protein
MYDSAAIGYIILEHFSLVTLSLYDSAAIGYIILEN